MLIKILGAFDIIIGAILIFGTGSDFPLRVLIFLAVIMIAKSSLSFWQDFGSWVDLAVGFIFLLMIIISIPKFIGIILGILAIQKGFISFL
ncbi:MAG: hypothetical protein WC584_00200 [Candidatus Pacearchaeota archaeon]